MEGRCPVPNSLVLVCFSGLFFYALPPYRHPRSPSASTSVNFLPIERLRGGGARQSNAELVSGVRVQIHCLPFLTILSGDRKNCSFTLRKVNFYIDIRSSSHSFVHYFLIYLLSLLFKFRTLLLDIKNPYCEIFLYSSNSK